VNLKPNLPLLGGKYGNKLPLIVRELAKDEVSKELLMHGRVKINDEITIYLNEVIVEVVGKDNFVGAFDNGRFVILDKTLTDELVDEGIAREIVHTVQNMRKEAKLEISDRIILSISPENRAIERFKDYIMAETLSSNISNIEDSLSEQDLKIDDKNVFILKLKKA
jgi:isoleucyl-tRNA synthetase